MGAATIQKGIRGVRNLEEEKKIDKCNKTKQNRSAAAVAMLH